MTNPVTIVPANVDRIRELVAEFDRIAARKTKSFDNGTYSAESFDMLSQEQLNLAYSLVGCLQGQGLGEVK